MELPPSTKTTSTVISPVLLQDNESWLEARAREEAFDSGATAAALAKQAEQSPDGFASASPFFNAYLDALRKSPHFVFVGRAGVGKSTTIFGLIKHLTGLNINPPPNDGETTPFAWKFVLERQDTKPRFEIFDIEPELSTSELVDRLTTKPTSPHQAKLPREMQTALYNRAVGLGFDDLQKPDQASLFAQKLMKLQKGKRTIEAPSDTVLTTQQQLASLSLNEQSSAHKRLEQWLEDTIDKLNRQKITTVANDLLQQSPFPRSVTMYLPVLPSGFPCVLVDTRGSVDQKQKSSKIDIASQIGSDDEGLHNIYVLCDAFKGTVPTEYAKIMCTNDDWARRMFFLLLVKDDEDDKIAPRPAQKLPQGQRHLPRDQGRSERINCIVKLLSEHAKKPFLRLAPRAVLNQSLMSIDCANLAESLAAADAELRTRYLIHCSTIVERFQQAAFLQYKKQMRVPQQEWLAKFLPDDLKTIDVLLNGRIRAMHASTLWSRNRTRGFPLLLSDILRGIITRSINQHLLPAIVGKPEELRQFWQQTLARVAENIDFSALSTVQALAKDDTLHHQCLNEWGGGKGYKVRVHNHLWSWINAHHAGIVAELTTLLAELFEKQTQLVVQPPKRFVAIPHPPKPYRRRLPMPTSSAENCYQGVTVTMTIDATQQQTAIRFLVQTKLWRVAEAFGVQELLERPDDSLQDKLNRPLYGRQFKCTHKESKSPATLRVGQP